MSYQSQVQSSENPAIKQTAQLSSPYLSTATPIKSTQIQLSNVNAQAYAVYDRSSGETLINHNSDLKLPIASLTKLMTALVIVQNHRANEQVVVADLPSLSNDIAVAGLKKGETYNVRDLISAMLVSSSADAAQALSIWDAGSETVFVAKMNDAAKQWGMTNTHYANVVGLDDNNNYSTAHDLYRLVSVLMQNQTINHIAALPSITITSANGGVKHLVTTNNLLGHSIIGLKTGTTAAAGECFIGHYSDGQKDLVTVILGSTDRFGETQKMLNYTFKSINWI